MSRKVEINPKQVKIRKAINIFFSSAVYGLAVASLIPLFFIFSTIFSEGIGAINPKYAVPKENKQISNDPDNSVQITKTFEGYERRVNDEQIVVGYLPDYFACSKGEEIVFDCFADKYELVECRIIEDTLKIELKPNMKGLTEITITATTDSDMNNQKFHIAVNDNLFRNVGAFLTKPQPPHGELGGGIANALVGTIMLILIATIFALPTGILGGLYLAENGRTKTGEIVRICMEVLQGVPSIVIGLIAFTLFVQPLGKIESIKMTFSALAGGLALGIMMLPIIVRTTEETLKMLPGSLKEASYALGAPYYYTVIKVLLPAGFNGILTAVLVSVGRIAGETAPLLFTSFGNQFMNYSVFKPVAALPHLIFDYALSAYDESKTMAWGASIVLILFILFLNISSRQLAKKFSMNKS